MMSAKKIQKSMARDVLVTSLQMVFGIIAGVVLCAAWLVMKPVTMMDGPPSASRTAIDRHEILYVRGKFAMRGAQGARKHKAFLEKTPGELVFVEEDLNRWLVSAYGSKEQTFTIQGIGVTVAPRVPATRLVDDELELGVEIAVEHEGGKHTIVAQARGKFVDRGGRQVFAPRRIYLGSCPVPWNLGGRELYEKLSDLFPIPENVKAAWATVGHAVVAESRLHLAMGSGSSGAMSEPTPAPVAPEPVPLATESAGALPTDAAVDTVAPTSPVPAKAPAESLPSTVDPATSLPAESTAGVPAPVDAVPVPAPESPTPADETPAAR